MTGVRRNKPAARRNQGTTRQAVKQNAKAAQETKEQEEKDLEERAKKEESTRDEEEEDKEVEVVEGSVADKRKAMAGAIPVMGMMGTPNTLRKSNRGSMGPDELAAAKTAHRGPQMALNMGELNNSLGSLRSVKKTTAKEPKKAEQSEEVAPPKPSQMKQAKFALKTTPKKSTESKDVAPQKPSSQEQEKKVLQVKKVESPKEKKDSSEQEKRGLQAQNVEPVKSEKRSPRPKSPPSRSPRSTKYLPHSCPVCSQGFVEKEELLEHLKGECKDAPTMTSPRDSTEKVEEKPSAASSPRKKSSIGVLPGSSGKIGILKSPRKSPRSNTSAMEDRSTKYFPHSCPVCHSGFYEKNELLEHLQGQCGKAIEGKAKLLFIHKLGKERVEVLVEHGTSIEKACEIFLEKLKTAQGEEVASCWLIDSTGQRLGDSDIVKENEQYHVAAEATKKGDEEGTERIDVFHKDKNMKSMMLDTLDILDQAEVRRSTRTNIDNYNPNTTSPNSTSPKSSRLQDLDSLIEEAQKGEEDASKQTEIEKEKELVRLEMARLEQEKQRLLLEHRKSQEIKRKKAEEKKSSSEMMDIVDVTAELGDEEARQEKEEEKEKKKNGDEVQGEEKKEEEQEKKVVLKKGRNSHVSKLVDGEKRTLQSRTSLYAIDVEDDEEESSTFKSDTDEE